MEGAIGGVLGTMAVSYTHLIGVYLLVAAVAALGWLWCALPEEVYLEPEQTLTLPVSYTHLKSGI